MSSITVKVPQELVPYVCEEEDDRKNIEALAFYYQYINAGRQIPKALSTRMGIIFGYEYSRSGLDDFMYDVHFSQVAYKYIDFDLNIRLIYITSDPTYVKGNVIYDALYEFTYGK